MHWGLLLFLLSFVFSCKGQCGSTVTIEQWSQITPTVSGVGSTCVPGATYETWFTFVSTASAPSIDLVFAKTFAQSATAVGSFSVEVYTGSCDSLGTPVVGCTVLNVDAGLTAVTIPNVLVTSYYILVQSSISIPFAVQPRIVIPDYCLSPAPWRSMYTQNLAGFTSDPTDPNIPFTCAGSTPPSHYSTGWFSFTLPSGLTSRNVTVDTTASNFDSILAVWEGNCANLTIRACNDDADPGLITGSLASFTAQANHTYLIETMALSAANPPNTMLSLLVTISGYYVEKFDLGDWRSAGIPPQWSSAGVGSWIIVGSNVPSNGLLPTWNCVVGNSSFTSPPINISTYNEPTVYFNYYANNINSTIIVDVLNGGSWVLNVKALLQGTADWQTGVVSLKTFVTSQATRIRFRASSSSVGGSIAIENFIIQEPQVDVIGCATLNPLTNPMSVPTLTSLSWTAGSPSTAGYYVSLGSDGYGYAFPKNTINSANSLTSYVNNIRLWPGTDYYLYVVPYSFQGTNASDCPFWTFTTTPASVIPWCDRSLTFIDDTTDTGDWSRVASTTFLKDDGTSVAITSPDGPFYVSPAISTAQSSSIFSMPLTSTGIQVPVEMTYQFIMSRNVSQLIVDVYDGTRWNTEVDRVNFLSGSSIEWTMLSLELTNYKSANMVVRFRSMGPPVGVKNICVRLSSGPPACPTPLVYNNTMDWSSHLLGSAVAVEGYTMFMGTDGGGTTIPSNIYDRRDLEYTSTLDITYTPLGTPVYYQLIPYNANGGASTCPISTLNRNATCLSFGSAATAFPPNSVISPPLQWTFFPSVPFADHTPDGGSLRGDCTVGTPTVFTTGNFDVRAAVDPVLSFWVELPLEDTTLTVELVSVKGVVTLDTLVGPLPTWTRRAYSLTPQKNVTGGIFKVQFSLNVGGVTYVNSYAYLDDLCLYARPPIPPCATVVPVTTVAGSSAVISWTLNSWMYPYNGFHVYVGTDGNGVTTPTNLYKNYSTSSFAMTATVLRPASQYYVQVRPFNNQGEAACPIASFTTAPVNAGPYCENFDRGLPLGWTNTLGNAAAITTTRGSSARWDHTSQTGRFLTMTPTTAGAAVWTTSYYNLTGLTRPALYFFEAGSSVTPSDIMFEVVVNGSVWEDESSFTQVMTDSWGRLKVDLTGVPSPVAFRITMDVSAGIIPINIDDFCITSSTDAKPGCATLTSHTVGGSTNILTSFRWNNMPNADQFYVYFGLDGNGINPPASNPGPVFGSAYVPPIMVSNKDYYLQVVPSNAQGNASACPIWKVHSVAPLMLVSYSFGGNGVALPTGWSTATPTVGVANITAPIYSWAAQTGILPDGQTFGDGYTLYAASSPTYYLYTQPFDLSSYSSANVSFMYFNQVAATSLHVDIVYNSLIQKDVVVVSSGSTLWTYVSFRVPNAFLQTSVQFRFYVDGRSGDLVGLDTFTITTTSSLIPNCPIVYSPPSTNAPLNAAITWTAGGGGTTGFNFSVSTSPDTPALRNVNNTMTYYNGFWEANTVYYVTLYAYSPSGQRVDCPAYTFTTMTPEPAGTSVTFDDGSWGGWTNDFRDSGEDFKMVYGSTYGPWQDADSSSPVASALVASILSVPTTGKFVFVDDSYPHVTPTNLLSPPVDLTSAATASVNFNYFLGIPTNPMGKGSQIVIDLLIDGTWNENQTIISDGTSQWTNFQLDLAPFLPASWVVVRIRVLETPDYRSDIAIDDIAINASPPEDEVPLGAILGGVFGGIAGILLVVGIVFGAIFLRKKLRERSTASGPASQEIALQEYNGPPRIESVRSSVNIQPVNTVSNSNYAAAPLNGYGSAESSKVSLPMGASASTYASKVSLGSQFSKPSRSVASRRIQSSSINGWEVDYEEIKLDYMVGSGAYGNVYKGKWRGAIVAVKQFKGNGFSEEQIEEFRSETAIMMALRPHTNLIQLLGISSNPAYPLCIIFEFMAKGSLESLLQAHPEFEPSLTLSICQGIAAGMMHLHMESIVHRDLAARNVLMTETLEVKISDFGLSRMTLTQEAEGQTKAQTGPLKWMAPESILEKVYSVKSDTWSYGVVIYEILTHGVPYEGMDAVQAGSRVALSGLRLDVPQDIMNMNPLHRKLADLMKRCMETAPERRPTMKEIDNILETMPV